MRGVLLMLVATVAVACSSQPTQPAKSSYCPAGKREINVGDSVGYFVYHPTGAADGVRDTVVARSITHTCWAE